MTLRWLLAWAAMGLAWAWALPTPQAAGAEPRTGVEPRAAAPDGAGPSKPLYLLSYDHGGLVLWGRDHFVERLSNAVT